ncbi:phospholipase D family protein [Acidithiobacillus ferriphilus]|uniref:phospholipase D family protein n=1 Tax=Acidithiobacillus ferriphilus TaxID=1689834 RepID=UPI001C07AA82|nr:phospholipase D family protein [Acidithiobacillus ferriphilus]MBU2828271.1 NgoFVII family restriction endonuclease [Acidithiobacillus ferriphilus]
MKLISNNKELTKTLSDLIRNHSDTTFAVAWASSGNPAFDLLQKNPSCISRAIIGTHFYQTHPDVLETFQGNANVHFVLQPNGVFHPKLYLFRSDDRWEALIGSANLTFGALNTNSEVMLLLGGTENKPSTLRDEILRLIDHYWQMGKTIKKNEAAAYREVWGRKQPALRRLTGQYGSSKTDKPPTASAVMSMSWDRYFDKVKTDPHHGFQDRCDLLTIVRHAFATHQTFASMKLPLQKTIAGLPNNQESRWGWFGSMQARGYYHQAVNNNNKHISQAIDIIPLRGQVTRTEYEKYIAELIKAFPNRAYEVGIASRLLALKRPDQFVCLNSKNRRALCSDFGITQGDMTYDRYWDEIIERILDTPWWNSKRPNAVIEADIWDGRAAMLDAIFYKE